MVREQGVKNMKNFFFGLDGPVIQFLCKVADCIFVSLLCALFCLPLVTIGASLAAANKVMCDIIHETDNGIIKGFVAAFIKNFMKATIAWLVFILLVALLLLCVVYVSAHFTGVVALGLYLVLLYGSVAVLGCFSYILPLIIRYENSMILHGKNAMILAFGKLPKTFAMILLNLSPLIIYLLGPDAFFKTVILWPTVGVGAVVYMVQYMMKPIYEELEESDQDP